MSDNRMHEENINNMNIQITDSARDHIQKFLATMTKEAGFKLGVKKSGCSGYAYIADVASQIHENEILLETNSIRIFVDKNSIPMLKGTVIDLIHKGLNQTQLQFNNPNVEDSCGCGESFTVKSDEQQ